MALANFVALGISGDTPTPLTDQGRTFSSNWDNRSTDVQLSTGLLKRYVTPTKHTFSLAWTMLPSDAILTYDQKEARDFIKTLVDGQQLLTLTLQRDSSGSPTGAVTSYDVWVESYSENIVRRDFRANTIWYDIQLELKQQ